MIEKNNAINTQKFLLKLINFSFLRTAVIKNNKKNIDFINKSLTIYN